MRAIECGVWIRCLTHTLAKWVVLFLARVAGAPPEFIRLLEDRLGDQRSKETRSDAERMAAQYLAQNLAQRILRIERALIRREVDRFKSVLTDIVTLPSAADQSREVNGSIATARLLQLAIYEHELRLELILEASAPCDYWAI